MKFPAIKVPEKDVEALESARESVLAELDRSADHISDLGPSVATFREIKGKIGRAGKDAVSNVIMAFMAAHPTVESLRWEHSSDEWNDEEYYFAILSPEVKLVGGGPKDGWNTDGYLDSCGLDEKAESGLIEDLDGLHAFFEGHEEIMRATFGGDSVVTVGRDGVAVVEERGRD